MEWIDGNIGSKLTMKYPSVYLVGEGATGEVLSVAYAGRGQHQDAGAKMVHAGAQHELEDRLQVDQQGRRQDDYRGLVRADEGAHGCKSHVQCDALILDEDSVSKTLPYMEVGERDASIGHEATVSKIADEQIFYLMSRASPRSRRSAWSSTASSSRSAHAPDGVRRRVEPPDRASDGGLGRLTAGAQQLRHPVGQARSIGRSSGRSNWSTEAIVMPTPARGTRRFGCAPRAPRGRHRRSPAAPRGPRRRPSRRPDSRRTPPPRHARRDAEAPRSRTRIVAGNGLECFGGRVLLDQQAEAPRIDTSRPGEVFDGGSDIERHAATLGGTHLRVSDPVGARTAPRMSIWSAVHPRSASAIATCVHASRFVGEPGTARTAGINSSLPRTAGGGVR